MNYSQIESIEEFDEDITYDIWNYDPKFQNGGNFFIDGVLVHNSIPEAMENRDDPTRSWEKRLKDIHPELYEILKDTYGIVLWQESLAAILQRLGGFSAPEAQAARKAVAKKWAEKLKPVGKKWIDGATKTIGKEHAEELWSLLVRFGRYAFNRCLSKDTILIDVITKESKTIEEWYQSQKFPTLISYDGDKTFPNQCVNIHNNGLADVYEVEFDDGSKEFVTLNHKFLCEDGQYHEVSEIINKGLGITKINAVEYQI